MNENGKNKREWVKTAAIIFLSIMLILTFFSNTIMNYSLPEVATQYVMSGTITAKIRGTGQVESGDPYEMKAKESRKVSSVAVRVGDSVQKGDILMYLEDAESEELKAAKESLAALRDAYNDYLRDLEIRVLKEELSQTAVNNAQTGNISSMVTYQNRLDAADNEIKKQQALVDEANVSITQLETWRDQLQNGTPDTSAEQAALATAQENYNAVAAIVENANAEISGWNAEVERNNRVILDYNDKKVASVETVSGNDIYTYVVSEGEYRTAVENNIVLNRRIADKLAEIQPQNDALPGLLQAVNAAQTALDNKSNSFTNNIVSANNQLVNWRAELTARTNKLQQLQDTKSELLSDIVNELSLDSEIDNKKEEIAKAQSLVDDLQSKMTGATINADISGTVSGINVVAGNTFHTDETIVTLQPEGKGYTMSFSVTNEQAKRLSVGDRADIVNAWRYDDINVILSSIKPDKTNPGQQKLLTFDVTGEVTPGQTLNVSVGQRSANYDLIVPNSALKEDSNGKFILIVESRPSPLSTRYIATRVDVEVLASDDTQSAISGALYGYEYVITTATKPVEAGKQVRLADN